MQLLDSHQYGYRDISIRLGRTEGAIKKKIVQMKLKQRPVRKSPHDGKWQPDQVDTAKKLYFAGYTPDVIAGFIQGKSACAVRGLLERLAAKGELNPPPPPPSFQGGTHYKKALQPDQWDKAEKFLRILMAARQYAVETKQRPDIDLIKFRRVFNGKYESGVI